MKKGLDWVQVVVANAIIYGICMMVAMEITKEQLTHKAKIAKLKQLRENMLEAGFKV